MPRMKVPIQPKILRVAVRLNPGRRHGIRRATAADRHQVPDAQEGSREQHENQSGRDVEHQQAG